jgi:hypothetical protein
VGGRTGTAPGSRAEQDGSTPASRADAAGPTCGPAVRELLAIIGHRVSFAPGSAQTSMPPRQPIALAWRAEPIRPCQAPMRSAAGPGLWAERSQHCAVRGGEEYQGIGPQLPHRGNVGRVGFVAVTDQRRRL